MPQLIKRGDRFNANLLTDKRISLGYTVDSLAKKLGLSKQAVRQWEVEICGPTPKSLLKLARILKVVPSYFYKNAQNQNN